jgi:hypothetical protein
MLLCGTSGNQLLIETNILFLDEQANKYRALDNWFMTPQGRRVAHAFAGELMPVCERFSGRTLLQLGSCGENLWLPLLNFRHKWLVTPSVAPQKTSLIASLTMLPVDRDSIDCVLAPLSIEAFAHGKNPMDEIDRVLRPMGYVIFFGINPCSFWGAALYLKRLNCFGSGVGTLMSSFSVKHMMLQRGYRQCAFTSFYYIPPVNSEFLIPKLEFFNEMGKMIWPFPAGFYCLIVQKYQHCSPSFLLDMSDEGLLMQQKSSLQGISKWMHE